MPAVGTASTVFGRDRCALLALREYSASGVPTPLSSESSAPARLRSANLLAQLERALDVLHRVGVRGARGPVHTPLAIQELGGALRAAREARGHRPERLLHERQVLEVLVRREEELPAYNSASGVLGNYIESVVFFDHYIAPVVF